MKVAHAVVVMVAVLLAGPAQPVFALDPFEWKPDTTDVRSYEQVRRKHAATLDVLNYPQVFSELQAELEHAPVWSRNEPTYLHLHTAMRVLNERFAIYQSAIINAASKGVALDAFLESQSTGGYQFPCPDGECFTAEYVVNYADLEALPDAKAIDFLYRARTLGRLLVDFKRPALIQTTTAIHLAKERWETFIEHGRSQYPWEALLNGWLFKSTIEQPPLTQVVIIHPDAAVEMTTNDLKDLRAKQALGIEVIGVVWHRWKDKKKPDDGLRWWGVSGIVSARDDMRPGVGLIMHHGRMVTLGLTWHDDDGDNQWFDRPPHILASFDLFQLAKDRVPEYQKKAASLAVALEGMAKRAR